MITAIGDPDMPIVERLESAIASHFDLIAAHPQLPRFFLNAILLHPEHYHPLYDRLKDLSENLFAGLQRDIDAEARAGKIERIDVRMLLISILSLNVLPFITYEFTKPLLGDLTDDREKYLAARKAENIETILRRIKKQ